MSHRRGSGRTGTAMQLESVSNRRKKKISVRDQMKRDAEYSNRMLRVKFGNRPMKET